MDTLIKAGLVMALLMTFASGANAGDYKGKYCSGKGDTEYLRLIDRSFEFFHPSPGVPNISMLYYPDWNCFVEGPKWDAWWIQNSYGTTYSVLPFLQEPWLTFLQNSQDMWFNNQGDGKKHGWDQFSELIGPEGALCDCARPNGAIFRQGDCNWRIHDWGFEFTAAGVLMQSELLLINRDKTAILRYLPKLEKACEFIETRRDPKNGMFLVGPGADLLAPSYGGIKQPDGTFGKGYLAGLSVTYAAALDRMVELYKLAGDKDKLKAYQSRAKTTRDSLAQFVTPEGYFIRSMATDGTRHGVLGQKQFGYISTAANVDAIAHREVDKAQAEKIYSKLASIPELRPHDFMIPNYPSYDDTYENWGSPELGGIWTYGKWVNGGVWSTQEARAIIAYYRVGAYEDIRRSAIHSMRLADDYQMDAPLQDFGGQVWFTDELTNLCYDAVGIPAATIRGLFEYVYKADRLTLYPHIPPSITEYSQHEPIRFGSKHITISIKNNGPRVASVKVNGHKLKVMSSDNIRLQYDDLPDEAQVDIAMEGGWPAKVQSQSDAKEAPKAPAKLIDLPENLAKPCAELVGMKDKVKTPFEKAYLGETLAAFDAYRERASRDAAGEYSSVKPERRTAILKMYENAALSLYKGFMNAMNGSGR